MKLDGVAVFLGFVEILLFYLHGRDVKFRIGVGKQRCIGARPGARQKTQEKMKNPEKNEGKNKKWGTVWAA